VPYRLGNSGAVVIVEAGDPGSSDIILTTLPKYCQCVGVAIMYNCILEVLYPFARNPNPANLAGNLRPQRRREQRQLREELHR
jgi:hypothetical protein